LLQWRAHSMAKKGNDKFELALERSG